MRAWKRYVPLVVLAGCAGGRGAVELTIDANGSIEGIASFVVEVENDGERKSEVVKVPGAPIRLPPEQTLALTFPADRSGALVVTVIARDEAGTPLGQGRGEGKVDPGRSTMVKVLLTPGMPMGEDMATGDGGRDDLVRRCMADSDCADPTPRCEVATGKCVACLPQNDNCAAGSKCVKRNDEWTCAMGCKSDGDCMKMMGADGRCCGDVCVDIANDKDHCNGCGKSCGGKACCAKACVDTGTDVKHCGACGMACGQVPGGTSSCAGGQCVVMCMGAFKNCNGKYDDGCEVNVSSDPAHCGDCGVACNLANAMAGCAMSKCTIAKCNAPFEDCDKKPENGCETDLASDPMNCSACGMKCQVPNGIPGCGGGKCTVASCAAPFDDCDKDVKNGCEIDTSKDAKNCGKCGTACAVANGVAACAGSMCKVASCNMGFGDCDQQYMTGCETDTTKTVAHCGMCGTACMLANAQAKCELSKCAVMSCSDPHADCDRMPANGCEVNTATSPQHCGGCNMACTVANGMAGCMDKKCTVAACNKGFEDCDKDAKTGCEVNTNTDSAHCGGCNKACTKGQSCAGGMCKENILIIGTYPNGLQARLDDVKKKLEAFGLFANVRTHNAGSEAGGTNPTLVQLEQNAAVLVYSDPDTGFTDPVVLGDRLAMYFENGGRVVTSFAANRSSTKLGGKFANTYMLIKNDGTLVTKSDVISFAFNQQNHPLLSGLVDGQLGGIVFSNVMMTGVWNLIAFWKNSAPTPLVVEGTLQNAGNRKRVDLNFYPPSDAVAPGSWKQDGDKLLRNALLYK